MRSQDNKSKRRIAFIQACWHRDIVDQSRESFLSKIGELGISSDQIDIFEVPGSLEIPLQAQMLAKTEKYSVIVAAGLIVDGGIYRHEFVAESVIDAMMRVQLDTEVPILSVVLTPKKFSEKNESDQEFFYDHFKIKGAEAAFACLKTLENLDQIAHI
jgi:6,7-dimethyl-8-ribityllumazine synthase